MHNQRKIELWQIIGGGGGGGVSEPLLPVTKGLSDEGLSEIL